MGALELVSEQPPPLAQEPEPQERQPVLQELPAQALLKPSVMQAVLCLRLFFLLRLELGSVLVLPVVPKNWCSAGRHLR